MKNSNQRVQLSQVEPHFSAVNLYRQKDLTNLNITMRFTGNLLTPISGVRRGEMIQIFDGLSRLKVANELNWSEVDVQIFDFTDEQIEEQLVLRNIKTNRSLLERTLHAETILGVLGNSQGKKRETIGDIELGDDDFALVGKEKFEIAAAVSGCGISASTLRKVIAVKDFVENGNEEVKGLGLLEKLESGIMKPNQAFELMKLYKKDKKEQEEPNLIEVGLNYYKGNHFELHNSTCEDLSAIPDKSVSVCVTSNPYFGQKDYPDGVLPKGVIPHGEESTVDEYIDKQLLVARGVYKKLKDTGSFFVVMADSYDGKHCMATQKYVVKMVDDGWYFNDEWIWKKNQKPQSVNNRLLPNFERILHFTKHPTDFFFREFKHWTPGGKFKVIPSSNDGERGIKKEKGWSLKRPLERFRTFMDEQQVARIIESCVFNWSELEDIDSKFRHLAPFPSYIPLLPILNCSVPGDTILDIYSGTATTAAVALQLGRNSIGYDTDMKSHKFGVKRLKLVEENLPSIEEIKAFEKDYIKDAA